MTEPPASPEHPGTPDAPQGGPQSPSGSPYPPAPGGHQPPDQGSYPPPQGYGAYPPPPQGYGGYPPPPEGYGAYPSPPEGYGGYPPPPPPYSGYPAPAVGLRNGFGVAALILGLLSLPAIFTVVGGLILGVAAIVLGILGRNRAKKGEANNGGIAIAGIVLGALGVLLSVVMGVLFAIGAATFMKFGGRDYIDCMEQAGSDAGAQQQCQDEFRGNIENKFSITITPTR